MLPLVGSIKRSRRRATVLLPEPDSPTRPRVSPRMMSSETPWMTREEPKSLTRSRASSKGSGDMRLLMQGYRRCYFDVGGGRAVVSSRTIFQPAGVCSAGFVSSMTRRK